jgi:putative ABC transport system permease protein
MQMVILRLAVRSMNRRLLQSLLFILGVALGVAVVIAIDLANGSASRAFALSTESVTGRATHQITGSAVGLDSDLYREIRLDLGIRDSAPIVTESVRVLELGDQTVRLLGVDPFAEPPFRTYLSTIEILGDEEGDAFNALTDFISQRNTALISETMANRWGVSAGDDVTIRQGTGRISVRIIGLLRPQDRTSQQALDDLMLTDIATAQEVVGTDGRISRIDLILPDDYDISQITAILPDGARLQTAQESGGALQQMTAAFEINLQALSLLAVVVGVFLIYNTVNFSVVQRRPVIGIMRSLGATKRQVFAVILGEALVLGLIGTVLGMALGIIFGRYTVGLIAQTISDLYFSVNVTTVTVDPITLLKGATLGIAASLGAAFLPSVTATRTPPAGSMRRSSFEEKTIALIPAITGVAVVFVIMGYLLLQIPTDSLFVSFGALFCIIFGGALFTPALLLIAMKLAIVPSDVVFGVVGRMAPRAITRSLSRTSVAVAALTIAVSVIVGVSVMIGSFRSTVGDWLNNTLGADIYISPPLLTSNQASADVDASLREVVASVEGIETVSASRAVTALAPDYPDMLPVNILVADFDIGDERGYVWQVDDITTALENGAIMVTEPFAFRRNITPDNNTLTLTTEQGDVTFDVAGVYYDYATDQGTVFILRDVYNQYWDDPYITSVAAYVEDPAELDNIIETLRSETLVGWDMQVQSNRALREGVFEVFERTFTITIALRLLATIVAFIGILSALLALQLENTRTYGVMRANGMTPRQLWQFTLIQTGLMGTVAGVLAVPLGIALAVVLVFVINVRSFGWTMQFTLPPDELALAFAVAVVAAFLAGIYPAYRLSTMNTSRALRSE